VDPPPAPLKKGGEYKMLTVYGFEFLDWEIFVKNSLIREAKFL
jgi:hypothetical protein